MQVMLKGFFLLIIILQISLSSVFAQVKIGVALPLMRNSGSEEEEKAGEQILKGINDAIAEYDSVKKGVKVIIDVVDTEKDPDNVLNIFNKFGSDTGFIAVFGPVYSSELIKNAGAGAFHKIPIITPTATYNFLAEKNEYLFQLNPTYDVRGGIMAKFAMTELGMKNFVILSEESYGKNFEESFTAEVNKNNGKIIFTKFYQKDKEDLADELEELRNKLFENERFIDFGNLNSVQMDKLRKLKLQFPNLNPDSLSNEKLIVSIYKLFGNRANTILDSIGISSVSATDNRGNYILGLTDAVYIPISNTNEIPKVVSEYFKENINLPILGTSDWNNEKVLDENRMYIKELYFDSDFFLKNNPKAELMNLSNQEIRNYYFGYDGMKLILDKISEGNNTRQSLNDALQKVYDYKTLHNNVTIKLRTNHEMSIMKFRRGSLEKIKDYVY
jgi:Periplasmic binding protein